MWKAAVVAGLIVVPTPIVAHRHSSPPPPTVQIVTCTVNISTQETDSDLNIRATPAGRVVGKLFGNTEVMVVNPAVTVRLPWVFIAYPMYDQEQKLQALLPTGWIYGKFLKNCKRGYTLQKDLQKDIPQAPEFPKQEYLPPK